MTDDLPKEFRTSRKVVTDKMAEIEKLGHNSKENKRKASRYANELKNPCLKVSGCIHGTGDNKVRSIRVEEPVLARL